MTSEPAHPLRFALPRSPVLLFFVRFIAAAASGFLFAAAFPDYSVGWLMLIAFAPILMAVVRAGGTGEAFLLGWIWQTTAWLLMVPWVVRVMSHYGGLPEITGILIFCALCSILGLYGGAFALIIRRLRLAAGFGRWLFVPLAWAALEYARTYLLTGFPWNLIATSMINYRPLVQFDRFAGPYALGILILLPGTLVAWWVTTEAPPTARFLVTAGVVIICFVWWVTGLVAAKLIARPTGEPAEKAALLQPNISQQMRWDNTNLLVIFQRMMTMTGEGVRSGAKIVVWPESTVPLSYASTDFYRQAIEDISRRYDVDIILGSVAEETARPERLWNAAFLVSAGKTVGHYDKIRLVPFGEYVPLRKVLFFAEKLVHAVGEFQFGTKDSPLPGKFQYGLAICYEIVYPQIARRQVVNGAEVLVTITNDAWYDGTAAPRQHLDQARLRAVETDRYLLRAGTTGISAVVDPTGRTLQELSMGRQGIVFAEFHPRNTITPYVRFGDWFAWLASILVGTALVRRPRKL